LARATAPGLSVGPHCRIGIWTPGEKEHRDRGDRSIYLFDPEGNRLEIWDYFREDVADDINRLRDESGARR
jgi:hypothetical protein